MCKWCVHCSFTTVYGWIRRRERWNASFVRIGYLGVQDERVLVPPFSRLFPLVSFWPSFRSWLLNIGLFLSFFLFCVFIDVLSSSRSTKTCKITWPISSHLDLKFRIDVPLSKVLNFSFQVLRTPNARRRERRICCTHAFGVARVVCREAYMNLSSANKNA